MVIRRVFKSGGSRCIAVPSVWASSLGYKIGAYVEIRLSKDRELVLRVIDESELKGVKVDW